MKGELKKYTVYIYEVVTDRTVVYHDENEYDSFDYLWTDGNYSCDCNREIFFRRVLGLPELKDEDNRCGNTRYFCKGVDDATGKVIFDELEFETQTEEMW